MKPLSDKIDLRYTNEWQNYDAIEIVPTVFGEATIKALRYSENGKQYVIANHAVKNVLSVEINEEKVTGYKWYNSYDSTGHAVAFLEIAEAVDTGTDIAVTLIGLSNNPADIIDTLYSRTDLQDFRIYCNNRTIFLNGTFNSSISNRTAISFILDQIGAVWSAGMTNFADQFALYKDNPPVWATIKPTELENWSLSCSLTDLVTQLFIEFDYNYATGKYRKSITIEAKKASVIHGQRKDKISLPWVKSANFALEIGTKILQRKCKPEWIIKFNTVVKYRELQPNNLVKIIHPTISFVDEVVIIDIDPNYGGGAISIVGVVKTNLIREIEIVNQSTIFDSIITEYEISIGNKIATLTITNELGDKLPGAKVWIDEQGPLIADADAKIRFEAKSGTHSIRIEADGKTNIVSEFTI